MTAVPRRSRRRRLAFAAIAVAMVWLVLELGGFAAWWFATGSAFTWQRGHDARARAHDGGSATATAATTTARPASEPLALHPYLGYVYDPTQGAPGITDFGFIDKQSPIRERRADRYVVAITGGSMALYFANQVADRFAQALQRSPALAGRTVEVVCLALGGYKQPQQLQALQLLYALGAHFDCVVDLDGFNEVVLAGENVPLGVPAWFPRSWARLVDQAPSPAQLLRLGQIAVLRQQRTTRSDTAAHFWWSPLAQALWLASDRAAERELQTLRAEAERATSTPSFAATGPGARRDLAAARAEMVAIWARCSRQLHALCRDQGTLFCHFLQPNQYVPGSKPIGAEEAARAVLAGGELAQLIATFYPQLQRAGQDLQRDGVPFFDLTTIYRDHAEPLYIDNCCHVGQAGNLLIAEVVAAAVRSRLDLAGVTLRSLQVTPDRLQLASPMPTRLTVKGLDDAGREHDISGIGYGVRFVSTPPEFVRAAADGRVHATRRGTGSLRVELGTLAIDVPVTATWPEQYSDATAFGPGGAAPILAVERRADADLAVQIAAIPAGAWRMLVWSPEPLPEKPAGVDTAGLGTLLVPGNDARATASIPVRVAAGQRLFVRFLVLAADATEVLAASNTVVLAPQ